MEFTQELIESGRMAVVAAFLLGFLTSVSPCPLATNIVAIGYISKDIQSRRGIFINSLLYTLGRIIAYSVLGAVLISILREGASIYGVQKAISKYGEILTGPIMILIGVILLFAYKINLPKFGPSTGIMSKVKSGAWGSLILGMLFALAFCPSSGLFYFGMLIPLSAAENGGYFLPVVFAVGTALPVITVSWFLAFSVTNVAKAYDSLKKAEFWLRNIIGWLFIFTGIYFIYIYYF